MLHTFATKMHLTSKLYCSYCTFGEPRKSLVTTLTKTLPIYQRFFSSKLVPSTKTKCHFNGTYSLSRGFSSYEPSPLKTKEHISEYGNTHRSFNQSTRKKQIHKRIFRVSRNIKISDDLESIENSNILIGNENYLFKDQTKEHTSLQNQLDNLEWKKIEAQSVHGTISNVAKLSKFRLTTLVVLTSIAGSAMAWSTFDATLLAATVIGITLTSSSAAAMNQYLEIPYDSQMTRTRNRPLITGQISPLAAFMFSAVTGGAGVAILYSLVNPLTALLGGINWVLYSLVYTPTKRLHIVNTWIGSIVGAIPPVMGYTAVTSSLDVSSLLLGLVLFSWQFPHFNALSWNLRNDYAKAGYRMMAVTNPDLCVRTAFRHSILLTIYTQLMSVGEIGCTTMMFSLTSLPLNGYLIYLTWKFKNDKDSISSRKLFRFTLVYLPSLILLMLLCKKEKISKSD